MQHRGHWEQSKRRGGNYAIIFALSMLTILGFAALAIDASYIRLSALQAQNAADAGAHAALVAYRSLLDEGAASTIAEEVVARNFVAGQSVALDVNSDITWGGWDFTLSNPTFDPSTPYVNAVQVQVRRDGTSGGPVDLLVAPVFGHDTANVRASAVGALRNRQVMLALDISSSMVGPKWDQAQQAVIGFLDHMNRGGAPFPGDQLGLVVFAGQAEAFTPMDYLSEIYEKSADRWLNELDWCDKSYVLPFLPEYHVSVTPACRAPYTTGSQDAGTWHDRGILAAHQEILATVNADDHAVKTIVLISDGRAVCRDPLNTTCAAGLEADAMAAADDAWADDISVFTVSINTGNDALQRAFMEDLARGYGTAYDTLDETDVPGMLQAIASIIPVAIVR